MANDPLFFDRRADETIRRGARLRTQRQSLEASVTMADVSRALTIAQKHPNASKGPVQAAVAFDLPDEQVEQMVALDDGGWFGNLVGGVTDFVEDAADLAYERVIKPTIRGAFLVADAAAQELVQRPLVAASAAVFDGKGFGEAYEQYGDSALVNVLQGDLAPDNPEDPQGILGTGFFAGGQAQAQSEAERVLKINGHRADFGNAAPWSRGVGAVFGYDSTAHNWTAGITQFAGDVGLDPLAIATGGSSTLARAAVKTGAVADGGKVFNALDSGVSGVRHRARQFDHAEANKIRQSVGLIEGGGRKTAIVSQAAKLVGDQRVLEEMAKATPYQIWRSFNTAAGRNSLDAKTLARLKSNDVSEIADIALEQIAETKWNEKGFISGLKGLRRDSDRVGERFRGMAPSKTVSLDRMEDALQSIDSMLVNGRVDYEQREGIFNELLELADDTLDPLERNVRFGEVYQKSLNALADNLHRSVDGLEKDTAQRILAYNSEMVAKELREYSTVADGIVMHPGSKVTINEDGTKTLGQSPMLSTQLAKEAEFALPDMIEVRRAATKMAKVDALAKSKEWTGDLGRFLTRDIFKPLAILRPAYVIRIGVEEQFRLAAAGMDSLFTHPFRFMQANILARQLHGGNADEARSFMQRMLTEAPTDASGKALKVDGGELGALNRRAHNVLDNESRSKSLDKVWTMASKPTNPDKIDEWISDGWGRELNQLAGDPGARAVARLGIHNEAELVKWARETPEGQRWVDLMSRTNDRAKVIADSDEELIQWMHSINVFLTEKTGGVIQETGGGAGRFVVRQHGDSELIEQIAKGEVSPRTLSRKFDIAPREVRMQVNRFSDAPKAEKKYLDRAINSMFDIFTGKPTNELARWPAFRQFYVKAAEETMDALATDDLREAFAKHLSDNLALTDEEWERIARSALGSKNKTGAFDQIQDLDEVLKARAAEQTKSLLFDVTKRSNAQQALEVMFPFLDAWAEVTRTWARLSKENPAFFLRAMQGFDSLRDQGVVYANDHGEEVFAYPGGGILSKFFPGDNTSMRLEGRVQGANLVAQGVGPGFGPMVQWGVGAFMSKDADFQAVREWLAPFGTGGVESAGDLANPAGLMESFTPAWARKGINLITKGKIDEVQWNSTVGDVMKVLAISGEYAPGDPDDQARLLRDAERGARFVLFLRSATQATAITGASAKFQFISEVNKEAIPTDWEPETDPDGQYHTLSVLANEYRRLLSHYNFDDEIATHKFVEMYGLEPYYVAQAKTRSLQELPVDEEGHYWVRRHEAAAQRHEGVIGYFVPPNEDAPLDYAIYRNQIDEGARQSLSGKQQVQLANATKARAMFNRVKEQVAPLPSRQRDEIMAMVTADLEEQFPGWREPVLGVDSRLNSKQKIDRLQRAVSDPDLADSPVTEPLATYFQVREQMLTALRQQVGSPTATLGRQDAATFREVLMQVGNELQQSNPAFAGVWTRLLQQEVEA